MRATAPWAVDAAIALALTAIALALRLPYYDLIPALTDETEDLYRSLLTARGELFGLTGTSTYIGSLWEWLAAGAFLLSGNNLHAPRFLMVVLGALTIPPTYLLGYSWGGRFGGTLAAALLSTSLVHIVVNSHIAWSNCMTPLFVTLAVWATWRAAGRPGGIEVRGRKGAEAGAPPRPLGPPAPRFLLAASLLWGLAVQTHPSALAFAAGAALFVAWRSPRFLRARWPYLAAGLFVLANLNLVVYNLTSGFDSLAYGARTSADYAGDESLTPGLYAWRVGVLLMGLLQNLGGVTNYDDGDTRSLTGLGQWPIAIAALAGVVWQWRRGNTLPGLLLAGTVLLLPLLNGKYSLIVSGRYLSPLLPVLFAGIGGLFAYGLRRRRRSSWSQPLLPAPSGRACLALAASFLVLQPLLVLSAYYERQRPISEQLHRPIFEAVERVRAHRQPGESVVIDELLNEARLARGNGRVDRAIRLILELEQVPTRLTSFESGDLLSPDLRCRDHLALVVVRDPATQQATVERLGLRDIGSPLIRARMTSEGVQLARGFTLYRLPRRADVAGC